MGKEILQKYTIFEVKRQLAEMEKQYGKEAVSELLGKEKSAEIDREFKKEVARRLEPYWEDIQHMNTAGFGRVCVSKSNISSVNVALM